MPGPKYTSLVDWLDKQNVVASAVGWVIAINANQFIDLFVRIFFIEPFPAIGKNGALGSQTGAIGPYNFRYGQVAVGFIELAITAVICYHIVRITNNILGWT